MGEISAGLENSYIRSVSYSNQNILIGTAQSEVLILNNENNEAGEITWVTRGHAEGELWGLGTHPSQRLAATASDDRSVRIWDLNEKKMVAVNYLEYMARSCGFRRAFKSLYYHRYIDYII